MATEPLPIGEDKQIPVTFQEVPDIHYRRSPQVGKLVAALAKAQLEFGKVLREAENEAFKRGGKVSKYATLDAVVNATRESLAKNELVIIALPDSIGTDGKLRLTSVLLHSSDEFIESTLTMSAVDKLTPHQVGSLLTYGRRYQWYGLTGTAPEDDDDGNSASGVGSREAAQAVAERKIAEFKAKNAKQPPKQYPDQLCLLPLSNDLFEVSGDPEVMNAHKELLLANGKRKGEKVHMTAEQLATFRYQFEDQRGGILTTLKPTREPGDDA